MISEEDLDRPFVEFLNQHGLSPKMRVVVLHAIAMADYDQDGPEPSENLITTREGIKTIALHSSSIGRFANAEGAFIYPMYGHGELPQAFCRCAAVKGALYVLRMPVAALLMDEEKKHFLIIDPSYKIPTLDVPSDDSNSNFPRSVARRICIFSNVRKTILRVFLLALEEKQVAAVRLLQLSSNLAVCPSGMFMAYLSTPCTDASAGKHPQPQDSDGSEGHLESTSESTDDMQPTLIWSCVYVQEITQGTSTFGSLWSCSMPDENLDYRNILESTKKLFGDIYPDEEFLPRNSAPVHGDDDSDSTE
ncbi:hypothetical protein SETIT_5G046900v2 [Setaria italica]|uniref:Uncharacterized protein n=1 Tax=Setaria italica TaxID=4555 RepID=A0A368R1N1_SETIT|nr:hypothetical protein SETIT_5G046900v2 [Setaria italica]